MTDAQREKRAVALLKKLGGNQKLAESYGSSSRRCLDAVKVLHEGTPFMTAWQYIAGLSISYLPDCGVKPEENPNGEECSIPVSSKTFATLTRWVESCGYSHQAYIDTLVNFWPAHSPPPTPMFEND